MAEMKDSGIEWIGMIPKNWNVDKIKYHLKRNEPKNPILQISPFINRTLIEHLFHLHFLL